MSEREAFQEKILSELEIVQARFTEFKAQAKRLTIEAHIKQHARHVEDLEQKVKATKARLKEMGDANDDTWELLKDGVENTWGELQATLEDTVTTFKE